MPLDPSASTRHPSPGGRSPQGSGQTDVILSLRSNARNAQALDRLARVHAAAEGISVGLALATWRQEPASPAYRARRGSFQRPFGGAPGCEKPGRRMPTLPLSSLDSSPYAIQEGCP